MSACLLASAAGSSSAQPTLKQEIEAADAALFTAFNARDAAAMDRFFSDRLEFFHDRGGMTAKPQTMKQFAEILSRPGLRVRREALREGLEIHPIPGVGAMHIGRHRFCASEDGKPEGCSVYGFSQVWEKTATGWQLLRVLSYGH